MNHLEHLNLLVNLLYGIHKGLAGIRLISNCKQQTFGKRSLTISPAYNFVNTGTHNHPSFVSPLDHRDRQELDCKYPRKDWIIDGHDTTVGPH